MTASAARLCDHDFVRRDETEAAELRRAAEIGTKLPLDWLRLAEEVLDRHWWPERTRP